jgi:hypothetical protein
MVGPRLFFPIQIYFAVTSCFVQHEPRVATATLKYTLFRKYERKLVTSVASS